MLFLLALVVFYAENHSEEMAFKTVKVSTTFMLFVMSNLAVYCIAEENKTTEQQWYHKVCLCHMRSRVSQNKCSTLICYTVNRENSVQIV